MYEFSPITDRIRRMREAIRDRVMRDSSERTRIITDAYRKYDNIIPMIKRPLALKELCERMTIYIGDDELIVGNKGPYLFSGVQYPEWGASEWIIDPIEKGLWKLGEDGLYHNPPEESLKHCISQEDFELIRDAREFWKNRKVGTVADAWQPRHFAELKRLNISSYTEGGMGLISLPAGHLVAGYPKILKLGYRAIRQQAEDWLEAHYGNLMGEDVGKNLFYESVVIVCDAAMTLGKRYAAACAEKAAQTQEPIRKAELSSMSEALAWISENPARNFREAVQGIMLYQVLIQIESQFPSPAFGRFDQYVWPYLKKDLENGSITMPEAQEIIDAFFLKANCFYSGGPAKLTDTTGIGNTYQHTTLGGVIPQSGEDATNPVTYMVLETVGRLKLHDPTISLRFNKNSPDKLWNAAIETSKLVGGLPLYQNDEVIIPALVSELGIALEDARDYGVIGCQEIVICGKDYPAPNGMHPPHASVWWAGILNMALNNGINPFNGEQASITTDYLYNMTSIEQVRDAIAKMGRHIMRMFISTNNYAEHLSSYYAPQAILSISIDDCMTKGCDVVNGGAKYNSYGGTATGLATLADSISTIKYMCFDQKLCTTRELYDAWMANWVGYEPLRQRILAEVPHYGNNDPYADEELKWCVELYYACCQECHSVRSSVYKSGLYGASDHVAQGRITFATPDGRKTGEPIADAMSPAQNRDKNGPTAVFESTVSFDHHHYLGGIALNMRLHPSVLSNEEGLEKVRDMTKNYFESGGLEVQYNVVDTATLRDAQQNPDAHRDLVVRIAGYSAYFTELSKALQDDIISRNENLF